MDSASVDDHISPQQFNCQLSLRPDIKYLVIALVPPIGYHRGYRERDIEKNSLLREDPIGGKHMLDNTKIARFIAAKRKHLGLTQADIAQQLKVSFQAVSKWETGASDPSTSNLLTLAKLFNTTAEELLREVQ